MRQDVRVATAVDAEAITRLVNAAFRIEDVFKTNDRTDLNDVQEHLESGEFLVLDSADSERSLAACVYLERSGSRAYFGMLSIDPSLQGRGLGRLMMEALESRAREFGCTEVDMQIINLREELPGFYQRFGYQVTGTRPIPDAGFTTRPCHYVLMKKQLST